MLLTSVNRARALHVPVLLLVFGLQMMAAGAFTVATEGLRGAGIALAVGTVVFALGSKDLRYLRVEGDQLMVRTIFSKKSLSLSDIALGMSVRHSYRGGPTYTIYALAGDQEVDLADSGSLKRAEKLRERLMQTLLSARLPSERSRRALGVVKAREAIWQDNAAQAQEAVKRYYASGKQHRTALWAVGLSVLSSLAVAGWLLMRK